MRISDLLRTAEKTLQSPTARLDAELLLSFVVDQDRAWLHAHAEDELDTRSISRYNKLVLRRSLGEPIAYIVGNKEFYGRQFYVNPRVLVPRPESEDIINVLVSIFNSSQNRIADIGCGSGALGVTAKLELENIELTCIDIDGDALAIAKKNARKYNVRAQFYQGDLLSAWPGDYDFLLCNLPYVPTDYKINTDATFEPAIALFGGTDGLDLYRKLFDQITSLAINKPTILTESLVEQHQTLRQIAKNHGYEQTNKSGLVQVFSPIVRERPQVSR